MTHEQPAVLGMEGYGHRPVDLAAAGEPGAVIAQEAMAIGEGGLVKKRLGPRRAHSPVDQYHWVSCASKVVVQPEAVDGCTFHLMNR